MNEERLPTRVGIETTSLTDMANYQLLRTKSTKNPYSVLTDFFYSASVLTNENVESSTVKFSPKCTNLLSDEFAATAEQVQIKFLSENTLR